MQLSAAYAAACSGDLLATATRSDVADFTTPGMNSWLIRAVERFPHRTVPDPAMGVGILSLPTLA